MERLSTIFSNNNLGHLVTEAYHHQSKTIGKLTTQQKKDTHDNLLTLAKSTQATPQPPYAYIIVSLIPVTISDFIAVASGTELYHAVVFDPEDFADFYMLIHQQTKKKKYRQQAIETVQAIDTMMSKLVDPHKRLDADKVYKHFVNGDIALLKYLHDKVVDCEADMAGPIARLSRKMRRLLQHNKIDYSGAKGIEATSVWMNELKSMVENRYDYDGRKENKIFHRSILRQFKELQQILETSGLYGMTELAPQSLPSP